MPGAGDGERRKPVIVSISFLIGPAAGAAQARRNGISWPGAVLDG